MVVSTWCVRFAMCCWCLVGRNYKHARLRQRLWLCTWPMGIARLCIMSILAAACLVYRYPNPTPLLTWQGPDRTLGVQKARHGLLMCYPVSLGCAVPMQASVRPLGKALSRWQGLCVSWPSRFCSGVTWRCTRWWWSARPGSCTSPDGTHKACGWAETLNRYTTTLDDTRGGSTGRRPPSSGTQQRNCGSGPICSCA